jgi:hypothetical protein
VDLDDAYYDLLGTLVAADEAAGRAQTFVITWTGPNEPAFVGVSGLADDAPVPTDVQVDNMTEFGWVRVTHAAGKARHFALRAEGQRAWRNRVAEIGHVPVPVSLDWTIARPLLRQIFEAYSDVGAPEMGVNMLPQLEDSGQGPETRALLFELARAGYLEVTWESADGPRMVRPAIPALQMFAGWPVSAAQDVLDELTEALDTEIDRTSDSDKRSKLIAVRDGLLGAARDIAIAWAEKKIGAA